MEWSKDADLELLPQYSHQFYPRKSIENGKRFHQFQLPLLDKYQSWMFEEREEHHQLNQNFE